jgi:hypothetical protein
MTKTFAVDENGDISVGPDGNFTILEGIEAVQNVCLDAVRTQLGEMVLAVDQGIPYFDAVWSGVPNIPQFEAALRKAVLAVDGVVRIISLNVIIQNDVLSYSMSILTSYGEGSISDTTAI